MKLSALIDRAVEPDPEIVGLTADSREAAPGFLFAALPGTRADGAAYIDAAVANGAVAILGPEAARAQTPAGVAFVGDAAPRAALARAAARFYPDAPETIVGITGTNGKTSTASFAAQLWALLGETAGTMGTLGVRSPGYSAPLAHTTPEPVRLHRELSALAGAGVRRLAMEVSSHALDQARADGVRFAAAGFTNISRDHLDYHPTFEAYLSAKQRLFTDLLRSDGAAVVNMDGAGADAIAAAVRARGARVVETGRKGRDLNVLAAEPGPEGVLAEIAVFGERYKTFIRLTGVFQIENALVALGLVIAAGADPGAAARRLEELKSPPGRMESVGVVNGGGVYVDYAHTPDAVSAALSALRPHAAGRLIAIVGAGGDRDRAKRPQMGAAATKAADVVIVTDDNPRSEDPAAIRAAIREGAPGALEIGDRAEAIAAGVAMLRPGDVLLIAGKGHETGQIVGEAVLPFSDAAVARAALDAAAGNLEASR